MSIMNFISHLGSAIARETDASDHGSAGSNEIAAEGEEGEEGDGPGDQPVGGGPPEPPCGCFGGLGCFGYSRRVHHSSSEKGDPQAEGRAGSGTLRAHPARISRAWGANSSGFVGSSGRSGTQLTQLKGSARLGAR